MAAVEYPMWVHKRTNELDALGFQLVPAALRQTLIDAGAAVDTFDHTLMMDDTAPAPPDVPLRASREPPKPPRPFTGRGVLKPRR